MKLRVLCIILSILLLTSSLPMTVFATNESTATEEGIEIVTMRDETVKHFLMPDGTYQAVVYPYPVHYLDSNGMWQDIDFQGNAINNYETYATASEVIQEKILFDTYISEANPSSNYGGDEALWVSENNIAYLRLGSYPVPDNAIIESASMRIMYFYDISTGGLYLAAHQVLESWNEHNITWTSAEEKSNYGLSTKQMSMAYLPASSSINENNPAVANFDITYAARNWQSGVSNCYGIGLTYLTGSNLSVKIKSYESESYYRAVFTFTYSLVDNDDLLAAGNVTNIKYTDVTTNRSSHLLACISSKAVGYDIFTVTDMLHNNAVRNYIISDNLKNELIALEEGYQSHLLPTWASVNESAAHAAKGETDQLVDMGYVSSGSSEYYGAWAYNYESELNLINYVTNLIDTATAIYGVYMAATTLYYSHYLGNITYSVSGTQYTNTTNQIVSIADDLTHNPSSNKVMLGTTTDTITWHAAGQKEGMTYFYTDSWKQYVNTYSEDMMRSANQYFLYEQKIAGKQFWFSHDPMITLESYPNTAFAMELNWLKESYGLTELTAANFVKSGSYWYFVP